MKKEQVDFRWKPLWPPEGHPFSNLNAISFPFYSGILKKLPGDVPEVWDNDMFLMAYLVQNLGHGELQTPNFPISLWLRFLSHEVQKDHIQKCLGNASMFYYHLGKMGSIFHLGCKNTFCTRKVFVFLK